VSVFAYVCRACDHLATRHGLAPGGDLRDGPYRCADCACEIHQDAPMYGLTRQQYERRFSDAPV
jgi:hypothetical protein